MALRGVSVLGDPGDDETGPGITVYLPEPASTGASFVSVTMVEDPDDPHRCFVDEGAYIDQTYCSWARFLGYEVSADRETLWLTIQEGRASAPGRWELQLTHPVDAECEAVLEAMAKGVTPAS